MDAGPLHFAALGWWLLGTSVHWASAAIARRGRPSLPPRHRAADFSIVAPMKGVADASPPYVEVLVQLARAGAEVRICVEAEEDGAVAPTRSLWRARLGTDPPFLVGLSDTFNPKMNNVRKGLEAASRPVVVLVDAGVAVDLPELRAAAALLSTRVGLVLALKAGDAPEGFAAEMERAYLNGHQARFLLAADRMGMAVASGGITLLTNDTLQRIGNWRGFNRWIADDYSAVRSVRELGLQTVLGNRLLSLPLRRRDWPTVWRRQVRWARTRLRLPVWPVVALEPLVGGVCVGLAGGAALGGLGVGPATILAGLAVHALMWLGAETWFLRAYGLGFGPRAALAALTREALAPVLMIQALASRTIDWRGADLGGRWRTVGAADVRRPQDGDAAMREGETRITSDSTVESTVVTVKLPDRLDSATSGAAEAAVLRALQNGDRVIVDGSAVIYMSAAGVRVLVNARRKAFEGNAKLVLCHFTGAAADCLAVSGFARLLEVAASTDEALARLRA